jgi:hypothetical protein
VGKSFSSPSYCVFVAQQQKVIPSFIKRLGKNPKVNISGTGLFEQDE